MVSALLRSGWCKIAVVWLVGFPFFERKQYHLVKYRPETVVGICELRIWEAETAEAGIQGQPPLYES